MTNINTDLQTKLVSLINHKMHSGILEQIKENNYGPFNLTYEIVYDQIADKFGNTMIRSFKTTP